MALSILLESLDHIDSARQTEVFQVLIACQECKQLSGYEEEEEEGGAEERGEERIG